MAENTLALMSFDGIHLLLPQQRVATIEMAAGLEAGGAPGSVGLLRVGALQWSAWALTAQMESRAAVPSGYRYCVAINHADRPAFAIVCEEVGTVALADAAECEPLQACMRRPNNPVSALLYRDGRMMLVSDVDSMQGYLRTRAAA